MVVIPNKQLLDLTNKRNSRNKKFVFKPQPEEYNYNDNGSEEPDNSQSTNNSTGYLSSEDPSDSDSISSNDGGLGRSRRKNRNKKNVTVSYTYDAFFISDGRSRKRTKETGSGSNSNSSSALVDSVPSVHSKDRARYTCTECGKHYATSSNLSRHKQTHRSPDSQLAKKCPTCNKVYVSMPALAMHVVSTIARSLPEV